MAGRPSVLATSADIEAGDAEVAALFGTDGCRPAGCSTPADMPSAGMSESVAGRALRAIGEHSGVREHATGMSSTAWVSSVGDTEYIVRVPVGDGKRPAPRYAAEARLLADLASRGAPVARVQVVHVDGHDCALAPRIHGRTIRPDDWNDDGLVEAVARFLTTLHATSPALAVEADIVQRFHLAAIWPFDGSELGEHPIGRIWPERVGAIDRQRGAIQAAAAAPATVVHSDLHPQHLLLDDAGSLIGVLDFGDAFAGTAAWDHACLSYYHGADVQRRVAEAIGPAAPRVDDVNSISIAWALYKLAKTPDRRDIRERVDRRSLPAVADRDGVRSARPTLSRARRGLPR